MTLANSTSTPDTEVLLLYGLSGQYAPMQRYLYYIIVAIALIGKDHWLTVGALASAMIYAGISSVHALVLASLPRRTLLDLDVLGSFQIAGISLIVTPWLLVWSRTLRHSPSRRVVRWWSVLLMVGTICSMVELLKTYQSIPPCTDAKGQTVVGPFTTIQLSTSCYNAYIVGYSEIRQPNDIMVISSPKISSTLDVSSGLSFIVAIWGSLFCIKGFFSRRESPNEKLQRTLRSAYVDPRTSHDRAKAHKKALKARRHERVFAVVSVAILLTQLIVVEKHLLGNHGLPVSEDISAVRQWGPCVGAVLVIIGAIMTHKGTSTASTRPVLPLTATLTLPQGNAVETRVASTRTDVGIPQGEQKALVIAEVAPDVSRAPSNIPHPPPAAHMRPAHSPLPSDTIGEAHTPLPASTPSTTFPVPDEPKAPHPLDISLSSVASPPLLPPGHSRLADWDGSSALRLGSCASADGKDNFGTHNSNALSGTGTSNGTRYSLASGQRGSASMTNIPSSVELEHEPIRRPASIHDISSITLIYS